MQYNGGRPEPNTYPLLGLDKHPYGVVHFFFGIDGPIESYSLDWVYEVASGRIPDNLFPIACDDGGDLLCLSLYGDDAGSVVFWDYYAEHCLRRQPDNNFTKRTQTSHAPQIPCSDVPFSLLLGALCALGGGGFRKVHHQGAKDTKDPVCPIPFTGKRHESLFGRVLGPSQRGRHECTTETPPRPTHRGTEPSSGNSCLVFIRGLSFFPPFSIFVIPVIYFPNNGTRD